MYRYVVIAFAAFIAGAVSNEWASNRLETTDDTDDT